jgi:type IV secretion system protein VirB9
VRPIALAPLLLCFAASLAAEVTPQAGPGDPHIQTVAYDPNEVVALALASGFALTIQFSADEQVETVILGDSLNWVTQTSRRADNLIVQPKSGAQPTNMTVFTDQRTYNFTLSNNPGGQGVQPFLVSFTYPSAVTPETPVAPVQGRYRLGGDRRLWPLEIGDDGNATTIRWPADTTLPAVYRHGNGGAPALVNGVMRDDRYVLDAVYPQLIFIRGKARARAIRQEAKR